MISNEYPVLFLTDKKSDFKFEKFLWHIKNNGILVIQQP